MKKILAILLVALISTPILVNAATFRVLVVGGGGGGGRGGANDPQAGGGGAGGYYTNTSFIIPAGSTAITVGASGNGATNTDTGEVKNITL